MKSHNSLPKGPWGSTETEVLLDMHMEQNFAADIIRLYMRTHDNEQFFLGALHERGVVITDDDGGTEDTASEMLAIMKRSRRAELPFAPLYESTNGYESIMLGKVLETGFYVPGSIVSIGLKGPKNEQWMGLSGITDYQARVLLDQVVDLDDAGLRPGIMSYF